MSHPRLAIFYHFFFFIFSFFLFLELSISRETKSISKRQWTRTSKMRYNFKFARPILHTRRHKTYAFQWISYDHFSLTIVYFKYFTFYKYNIFFSISLLKLLLHGETIAAWVLNKRYLICFLQYIASSNDVDPKQLLDFPNSSSIWSLLYFYVENMGNNRPIFFFANRPKKLNFDLMIFPKKKKTLTANRNTSKEIVF